MTNSHCMDLQLLSAHRWSISASAVKASISHLLDSVGEFAKYFCWRICEVFSWSHWYIMGDSSNLLSPGGESDVSQEAAPQKLVTSGEQFDFESHPGPFKSDLTEVRGSPDDLSGVMPTNWNIREEDYTQFLHGCNTADVSSVTDCPAGFRTQQQPSTAPTSCMLRSAASTPVLDHSGCHSSSMITDVIDSKPSSVFQGEFDCSLKGEQERSTLPTSQQPLTPTTLPACSADATTSFPLLQQQQPTMSHLLPTCSPPEAQLPAPSVHHIPIGATSSQGMNRSDEKPTESYVELLAKAIMGASTRFMLLNEIYSYILAKYPYFRTAKCAWRSSIRHALSTNECFIMSSRSPNGRGHYWGIHPACLEDFRNGDYNRRQARKKVQKLNRQAEELRMQGVGQQVQMASTPVPADQLMVMQGPTAAYGYANYGQVKQSVYPLPGNSAAYRFQQINDHGECFTDTCTQ